MRVNRHSTPAGAAAKLAAQTPECPQRSNQHPGKPKRAVRCGNYYCRRSAKGWNLDGRVPPWPASKDIQYERAMCASTAETEG